MQYIEKLPYWQRKQLELNKLNGKNVEERNRALRILFDGFVVRKMFIGADLKVKKYPSPFSPKCIMDVEKEWVEEVKSGNAKLTKRQKELQKKLGKKRFIIKRYN